MTRPTPADAHDAADRIEQATSLLHYATCYEQVDTARSHLRRLGFWTPKVADAVAEFLRSEAEWAIATRADLIESTADIVEAVMCRQPDRTPRATEEPSRVDLDYAMSVAREAFGITPGKHRSHDGQEQVA